MRKKMRKTSLMERMRNAKPVFKAVEWKKPRTGSFIEDLIVGNQGARKLLRRWLEEREKQSSAGASQ
jgi:glycerol kinase